MWPIYEIRQRVGYHSQDGVQLSKSYGYVHKESRDIFTYLASREGYGYAEFQRGYQQNPRWFYQAPHQPFWGYGDKQEQKYYRYGKSQNEYMYDYPADQAEWKRTASDRQQRTRFAEEKDRDDHRRRNRRHHDEWRKDIPY